MPYPVVKNNVEDPFEEDLDEVIPFKYSITSYGADYPVDGLVKRLREGSIFIPPFQRGFVWPHRKASRFIESLLLGLPVPGIFLSKDEETQKLMVIDGQQRLKTLLYFYDGIFADTGKEFSLKSVQSKFEGVTYKTLLDEDRRRLDDSILHATIVKQDEPSEENSSVYHVFERLNTGGVQLQPQEIRASIYMGEFSEFIKTLNRNEAWRSLYGPEGLRMRDQELILRFVALYFQGEKYKKPMNEFLNAFMASNRHLRVYSDQKISEIFIPTVQTIQECIGDAAFKPYKTRNAAVFDSVMIGVASRLVGGVKASCDSLKEQYRALLENDIYKKAIETATTDEENVSTRLKLAKGYFSKAR